MPSLNLPQVSSGLSNEELSDILAKALKEIDWLLNGFVDSKNVRNIAGFNVGSTELKHISGIVGMSGANPSTATAVRFWAGHSTPTSAPFQVWQDGTVKSTKGIIGGFVIGATSLTDAAGTFGLSSAVTAGDDVRFFAGNIDPTLAPFRVTESGLATMIGALIQSVTGYPRIELNSLDNILAAYSSADDRIKLVPVYSSGPPAWLFDIAGATKGTISLNTGSFAITTLGATNLNLQSAQDINLSSNGVLKIDDFTAFSGTFNVVADVNFGSQTVDYTTVTVKKGIITDVSAV